MDEVKKTTNWHEINISLKQGRYTIKKYLGEGERCITYLAEDSKQKKLVAIKTLKETVLTEDKYEKIISDFGKEADISFHTIKQRLTQLNDKDDIFYNIVHYEDIFTIQVRYWNFICLVMEYIEGKNLKELLEEQVSKTGDKVLDETKALDYIRQVGKALTFVHKNDLLHRDITPRNIIIRNDIDKPVLIDFGIARFFIRDNIQTFTVGFTPGYAPLEQYKASNNGWGAFTDIYGLAATLYYLLTGEEPVAADKREQGYPLKEPRQINTNISDNVNQAILKGMALKASERPQTVEEWLELLNPDKVKFDAEVLRNSPDELEKVINTLFNSEDFIELLTYLGILSEILNGNNHEEQVKALISKLQEDDDGIERLIKGIKYLKAEFILSKDR